MRRPSFAPRAHRRALYVGATIGMLCLVAAVGLATVNEQTESIEETESRFEQRIELAGKYVQAHVADMADRQRNYAEIELSHQVSPAQFDAAALAFGFEAAVLLDVDGRAIAISPQKPTVVGTDLGDSYAHLASALVGRTAVSGVVPSAAVQKPIVAVAVPFDTANGRRVISGGYDLTDSPLRTFLSNTTSLRGRQLYLVDEHDKVIAATEPVPTGSLELHAPEFLAPSGEQTKVDHGGEEHLVVTAAVGRTRWRLVAAVPTAALHAPVHYGTTWALLGLTLAMTVAVLALLRRTARQHDMLDVLSRTDVLTGLMNRRDAERSLHQAMARSARTERPCAVAMVDIDHFKSVNDRFGHGAGDEVLRQVAAALTSATRDVDIVARWGGEEFLVIMEGTDAAAAGTVADRLVDAVADAPESDDLTVTVSIGTAATTDRDASLLIRRADEALYEAKAAGRNRVVAAATDPRADGILAPTC